MFLTKILNVVSFKAGFIIILNSITFLCSHDHEERVKSRLVSAGTGRQFCALLTSANLSDMTIRQKLGIFLRRLRRNKG